MLASMFFTQMNTAGKLQGSSSSFRSSGKWLCTLAGIVMLLAVSAFKSQAQVLTASYSPAVICEGNNVILKVDPPVGLPSGVTVLDYTYYYPGSIQAQDSAVFTTPQLVPVLYDPGVYNPYVVARLSNGTKLTSNSLAVTVWHRPRPNFTVITQDTQCFRGNSVCFQNLTVQAPSPSSPIVRNIWEYGDAFGDTLPNNGNVCHSYTFPGNFTVTLKVYDSVGCFKDIFLPSGKPVVIKPIIKPEFTWTMRKGPCFISNYLFTNKTPVPLSDLQSYTWDFGDGKTETYTAPFDLNEMAWYDTISHNFTINGEFNPLLSVTDLTGCTDSIRYTAANATKPIPKNIRFEFDIVTTKSATDFASRDTVCLGSGNNASICFKQTPITFASAGTGDFVWNFDDPQSQQQNFDIVSWNPCHTFVGGLGTYNVSLTISNICPTPVTYVYKAAATLERDKYIDKIIYANNDVLDGESTPLRGFDTIITSVIKDPLRTLTYTGNYIMSGTPYRSDTLYVYKGVHERPLYYISDNNILYRSVKVDTIITQHVVVGPPSATDYDTTYVKSFVFSSSVLNTITLPLDFITTTTHKDTLKSDTIVFDPINGLDTLYRDSIVNTIDTILGGYKYYGYGVRIVGPFARIEDPQNGVVIKPNHKNQCGPSDTVDFVNTAQYYKSRKMYRRWDFDDNFAPQCTSFSIPRAGFPPYMADPDPNNPTGLFIRKLDSITYDNGLTWVRYANEVYDVNNTVTIDTLRAWTSAMQQYLNSDHYFIANKQVYGGKMNCKFSYDSLPRHHYPNWDTVYRWYNSGHDFMPWDPSTYGNGPGLIPIHPGDSTWWGKNVYLNPTTGAWSLTQGTGPAPYGLWARIDTINFRYNNGQDLRDGEPINIRNLPDPWRSNLINTKGEYPVIQSGSVEPSNTISYTWLNSRYSINGSDLVPGGGNMSFYKYAFIRTISRCVTVRMNLQDSFNNETTQGTLDADSVTFDSLDCKMQASVQLPIARADGRGLGKSGKECPGANPNVIKFELAGFGNLPGVMPSCGQTFILFNFDSLADRMDNTPCVLDGFMTWTGDAATPTPGTPSTTPGGRVLPAFWTNPNFTPAPRAWQSAAGTQIVFHYGLNAPQNVPPPADTAQGWVTVGIVIGSGCKDSIWPNQFMSTYRSNQAAIEADIVVPVVYNNGSTPVPGAAVNYVYKFTQIKNFRPVLIGPGVLDTLIDVEYTDCNWAKCMSDTVWYHRFLRINNLTARFDIDPVNCKLRHKGEEVIVHYQDTIQDDIKYSVWDWGDNTATVDSFYYLPDTLGVCKDSLRTVKWSDYLANTTTMQTGFSTPLPAELRVFGNTATSYNYTFYKLIDKRYDAGVADTVVTLHFRDCQWSDGFFTLGARRVRYNFDFFSGTPEILDSTVWPVGAPGGPYIKSFYDSAATVWKNISTLSPISLITRANPPGSSNGEYRITSDIGGIPKEEVVRWDGTRWNTVLTVDGTQMVQTPGMKKGIKVDTVLASNFYRIFNIVSRTAIPGSIIVIDKCSGIQDTLLNSDTMAYFPPSQIVDSAMAFFPLKHVFKRTSWEVARKVPGATTGNLIHLIGSTRGCTQTFARGITIGIVDTFDILNSTGQKDTLYCENEEIFFIDSLRYFRYDCQVTELPFVPAVTKSAATGGSAVVLAAPYDNLQIDSADFWRQDVGDPRPIQNIIPFLPAYRGRQIIDTVVAERMYWDYGDGSPIDSNFRPSHRYAKFGRYKITLYSKDSLGWFDTTYGYVNISKPVAKIGFNVDANGDPITIFNCGTQATFIDSSRMEQSAIGAAIDSVKTNYWWFGDNKLDTTKWQTFGNFRPIWNYRSNGLFVLKLVSESYLGCKDTTYDSIFVRGPRPEFRLLDPADTIGCAPFKVRLINMADSSGKFVDRFGNTNPSDTPTLATYFDWGDKVSPQTISEGRRDTIEFVYKDSGVFEIYGYGYDAPAGQTPNCARVVFPDTLSRPKFRITVLKLPHVVTVDKPVICKDQPITITNSSSPDYTAYNYVKYSGTTKIDSVVKNQIATYSFPMTFTDTGSYKVVGTPLSLVSKYSATAAENCKIPDTLDIKVVYPRPLFTIDTSDGAGGSSMPLVKLVNTSDSRINMKYAWTVTKDGSSTPKFSYIGDTLDPNFEFDLDNDTGTFTICLKSYAAGIDVNEGCTVDTCQKIENRFNINIEIPNVFTPNNDGLNDVFKIRTEGIQKYKLFIYNRWGSKVFESGDPNNMWNGKVDNSGAESPAGTYYYILDYQLRTEGEKTRTGTVTLIRQ